MTITELKELRRKLTADPIGNKNELIWIRAKIKSLQTLESNKRKPVVETKLSLYDSKDADKHFWAKANLRFS